MQRPIWYRYRACLTRLPPTTFIGKSHPQYFSLTRTRTSTNLRRWYCAVLCCVLVERCLQEIRKTTATLASVSLSGSSCQSLDCTSSSLARPTAQPGVQSHLASRQCSMIPPECSLSYSHSEESIRQAADRPVYPCHCRKTQRLFREVVDPRAWCRA